MGWAGRPLDATLPRPSVHRPRRRLVVHRAVTRYPHRSTGHGNLLVMAVDVDPEEPAGLTALSRLAEAQAGVVTVGQLSVLGVSRSQLRSRLRREWRYVPPRVVAPTGGPLNEQQRYVAALLYAGRDAALASLTAAAWHGVKAARVDHMVRVIVPIDRCVIDQSFVVVRRTTRADEGRWVRGPLTLCRPARSVADAAREAGGDQARAIVIEAVQKRLGRAAPRPDRPPPRPPPGGRGPR